MFGNKKMNTLAEDFKSLGLIKETSKTAKPLSESKTDERKKAIQEKMKAKRIEDLKKKKLAEAKKAKLQKLAEDRKRKIIAHKKAKLAEQKRARTTTPNRRVEAKTSVTNTLENLMKIESKLNTNAPLADLISALQNVTKISELAQARFRKVAEADLTAKGRDGSDVAPAQQASGDEIGKGVPASYKDRLDPKEGEGQVSHDKEDEQDTSVDPGAVDTVTGKQAGEKAYNIDSKELDLMGEMEDLDLISGEDDEEELELDMDLDSPEGEGELGMDDELKMDDEEPLGMEMDDELELGDEELSLDDEELSLGDDELEGLGDEELEGEPELDVELEMGADMDFDLGDEPLDDVDLELGAMADSEEDELVMNGEDEEEDEEMMDMGMESKAPKSRAYISELKKIQKESEDILKKINKHALSPQDAEALLKDVVMRLGGAVGDLHSMEQFAASGEAKSMGESKKKKINEGEMPLDIGFGEIVNLPGKKPVYKVPVKGRDFYYSVSPDIAARGGLRGKGTTVMVWDDTFPESKPNKPKGAQKPFSKALVMKLIKMLL